MIQAALRALRQPAGVVLAPTCTLYGLSGLASDGASNRRIAALKGRPVGPLVVLVERLPSSLAERGFEAIWPGPVTVLLSPRGLGLDLAPENLGPDGRVALRWDAHPQMRALTAALGPLTSTSANPHGAAPLSDPARCPFAVDAIVDVGLLSGPPSTMLDLAGRKVLRSGAQLQAARAFLERLH